MYAVTAAKEKHSHNVYGNEILLKLSWATGMFGVMPVFEDYDSALEYADGRKELIVELEKES